MFVLEFRTQTNIRVFYKQNICSALDFFYVHILTVESCIQYTVENSRAAAY